MRKLDEISDYYQSCMDGEAEGVLFVDFSMRQNERGGYDAWVAINLYGDTKRLYHNRQQPFGNPLIDNPLVLEALNYLPERIKKWIPEMKDYKREDKK